MRFPRWPKPTFHEDTPRKRAAYLRKQDRECESLPLAQAADTRRVVRRHDPCVRRGPGERELEGCAGFR